MKTDKWHTHSQPKNKANLTLRGGHERLLKEDNINLSLQRGVGVCQKYHYWGNDGTGYGICFYWAF